MNRYCGYCGKPGHNKRTCPDRDQEYKDLDKNWMNKPGPSKGSRSQCSYCGLYGHNRRTCQHLAYVRDNALLSAEECVREGLSAFRDFGVGPGTMYELDASWGSEKWSYVVTGEVSVSFHEAYEVHDYRTLKGNGLHPTFEFHAQGQKVFGSPRRERDGGPSVKIHCDVRGRRRPIRKCKDLLVFGTDESYPKTRMMGKSSARFREEQVEKLTEWSQRLVREWYARKETKHGDFADEYQLEVAQAELGY